MAHFGNVLGVHPESLFIVTTVREMFIYQIGSRTNVLDAGCGLARVSVNRHWKLTGRLQFLLDAFIPDKS